MISFDSCHHSKRIYLQAILAQSCFSGCCNFARVCEAEKAMKHSVTIFDTLMVSVTICIHKLGCSGYQLLVHQVNQNLGHKRNTDLPKEHTTNAMLLEHVNRSHHGRLKLQCCPTDFLWTGLSCRQLKSLNRLAHFACVPPEHHPVGRCTEELAACKASNWTKKYWHPSSVGRALVSSGIHVYHNLKAAQSLANFKDPEILAGTRAAIKSVSLEQSLPAATRWTL